MADSVPGRLAALVDELLVLWVVLSVVVGVARPSVAVFAPLTTPMLAVMVGSVSLTLAPERFRRVRGHAVVRILAVQTVLPVLAFAIAVLLGLDPALTAGFVVLGAVTPELVTPTMTELGGGDTALSTVVLLAVGVGSLGFVPGVLGVLVGPSVAVDPLLVVEQLALAVVLPMSIAVAARYRWPDRVGRYDDLYPSVSGLMVVLVVGIVAAANASLLREGGRVLALVGAGAIALNGSGYLLGRLASRSLARGERIAATLSVGMRDFAVAAAVLVGAGFPTATTLPAVVFGVVEMATSAGLIRWFRRSR